MDMTANCSVEFVDMRAFRSSSLFATPIPHRSLPDQLYRAEGKERCPRSLNRQNGLHGKHESTGIAVDLTLGDKEA